MSSLSRELVFLILQFLEEEKFKETVHMLEKESAFFFNMRYFEDCVTNGEWDEVEKYLSGFIKVDDNRYSMKIFFEIRKQKYLEALDRHEHPKAVEILLKDLKVFSQFNEELFKEITVLLTLGNFRENEQLSKYGDTKSARAVMLVELKKLIEANPLFRDKLQFPTLKNSRLRTLINQSLNWQHQLCKNPRSNPDIKTLFVDHTCGTSSGTLAPSPITNPLMGSFAKIGGFPALGAHGGPFLPAQAALSTSLAGWMVNPSVPHQTVSAGSIGFTASNNGDSEHVLNRSRPLGLSEGINNLPINSLPVMYTSQNRAHPLHPSDDLPRTVVMNLNQGSAVKSMDFHPVRQTLLLVGTSIGDITIWEVGGRERLVYRSFKIWEIGACSMALQALLAREYTGSVNRVVWSPDGALFGVAYSKHIVQMYSYNGGDDLRNHLELEAHVGNVNDLAFSHQNKQLCIITCGEDKTIKVWDVATGVKLYSFEGHEAPVYCVCPHQKENIQFIFSTAINGKIKAWLYDNFGSRVDYDAPGQSCTTMAYSGDGTRLFSCGTSKEGESYIVEWSETEGTIRRLYHGLGKRSVGVVQFDTMKSRFLAAGDEFQIKFWDMDNVDILTTTDADGGLPASPCVRFNKEGILLAVSTSENGIKILANADGLRLLHSVESHVADTSRVPPVTVVKGPVMNTFGGSVLSNGTSVGVADKSVPITMTVGTNGDGRSLPDAKENHVDDLGKSKVLKLTEINESSQLRSLRLPDNLLPVRISRLKYTNSGISLLALTLNAVHKLWKWHRNEQNPSGKATCSVLPQLWQPPNGMSMTNDVSEIKLEDAVSCFALSKNDSYVISASGGQVSLFNMMTFKKMTTFLPPPPAPTFFAFHPQDNNIIAIAMDDSSIQIYNIRIDKVISMLKGHQKRVTGLAFSNILNILVSSGADAQLFVWSVDGWEKQTSKFLQIPSERVSSHLAQTCVQFHQDQKHVLAVHETQIAIYEAPKLECLNQWFPRESCGSVTDATYSCDGQSIYASIEDGSVCILTAKTLLLRCRIDPTAYLPSNPSSKLYPVVIAAHPFEPNQFALGLSDGGVHVLEPPESDSNWGTPPPLENVAGPSTTSAAGSDQQAR